MRTSLILLVVTLAAFAGCADQATTHLVIEYPDGTSEQYSVAYSADDTPTAAAMAEAGAAHPGRHTALDQLETAGVSYNVTYSEFGPYVQAIDGITAGNNSYWSIMHNGEPATVGAGSLTLAEGDEVTWRLETFAPMAEPISLDISTPSPETTQATIQLTVNTSRPALVHVTNGNDTVTSQRIEEPIDVTVELHYGRNQIHVTADDEGATATANTTVVRLAEAIVKVQFNGYPGVSDRDDSFWFDIEALPSAPQYDDLAMDHPGNATIHDAMVAWEQATGVPVTYASSPSFGYSVTHIDGAGNPLDASAPPWWCYTVDGQAPGLGISTQPFTPGSVILWDLGDCGFVA